MAIDHEVCTLCGRPNHEHPWVGTRLEHETHPRSRQQCPTTFFTPKPPAPKAKPGVRYHSLTHVYEAIGLADGSLAYRHCKVGTETGWDHLDFTPDWQEVK